MTAARGRGGLAPPFVLVAGGSQDTDGALWRAAGLDPEPVHELAPAGRVGTRVPHRWLDDAHTRSTLDLGGPGWALLAAGDPGPWERAAGRPRVHRIDADFLPTDTALLLRPDDVVAWCGTDVAALSRVLRELLHPSPGTA